MKLSQIAEILGLGFEGPDVTIDGFSPLNATKPGTITWSRTGNKVLPIGAAAIICPQERIMIPFGYRVIHCENPRGAFAYALSEAIRLGLWEPPEEPSFALWDVHPRATIYGKNVIIGEDCDIQPGAVIGGNGFSFDKWKGEIFRFPHIGRCILGNRVEVQANACIARGSLCDTVIGDDVKIDRLVHVAHNVHIGEESVLTAGAIIGGSVEIGKRVWVGLNAVINDNLKVGEGATIGTGAVVIRDVVPHTTVVGNPAREIPPKKYHFRYMDQ